jgi:predicted RNase H-like HicB family nuclease
MKKYLVIYEKAKENYSAYSPDIPGCIATGKTRKETEKNRKEAISLHIDGLKEDGQPLPDSCSYTEYVEIK